MKKTNFSVPWILDKKSECSVLSVGFCQWLVKPTRKKERERVIKKSCSYYIKKGTYIIAKPKPDEPTPLVSLELESS